MVNSIYSYCLINTEVALSLIEIDKFGERLQVLEKRSPTSFKHSIMQVFGFEEALKLVPYAQVAVPEDLEAEFGLLDRASSCEVAKAKTHVRSRRVATFRLNGLEPSSKKGKALAYPSHTHSPLKP